MIMIRTSLGERQDQLRTWCSSISPSITVLCHFIIATPQLLILGGESRDQTHVVS